ncbi:MAG: TonB-dependent receptor [Saprospiraceae bacterium]|nr:TonB-dependent receptor [Saprospiraceae bacterium]
MAIVLCGVGVSFGQRMVSGTVTDDSGAALIGANVVAKEANGIGTITDIDGSYKLQLPDNVATLIFSYAGYDNKEMAIGTSSVINVSLSEGKLLEEIVVVGYGTQRKSDATSAISSVSGQDIAGLVTPSFAGQLAGRASGVQITTNSGIIGQAPRIRIRGIASVNSGTDPLIVVDGMPIYSGDLGGYADASGLGDINPADIESYEVLKDGAATAIYGSRGANGVILITTKKGKKGSVKVTLNSVFGVANPVKTFDLLKTSDFITIANEKRTNRGQTPWAVGTTYDTDWQAAVLNENAFQTDHTLGISGGTDATTYYFSLGYGAQDGVAKANNMNRFNFKTNLEHKVFKWLTTGGGIAYAQTKYNGLNTGRNSLSGNIFNAIRQLPNTPIYNENHPTGYNLTTNNTVVGQWDNTDPVGDNISNIGYVIDNNIYESTIKRVTANAYLSADIYKGLTYKLIGSIDNPLTSGFLYWSPVHGDGAGSNGRLQNSISDFLRWNLQHVLNYNTVLGQKHSIGVTGVAEYQKDRNESYFSIGTDLLNEFYNQVTVTNSYSTQQSGGGATEVGIISYLGRLNYNYDQKYFGQFSYRRDGLSKLSPANRWNDFIGYSLGWNVTNESFMESAKDIFSQIKLRYSFAAVGNTEVGNYPYLGLSVASPYGTLNGIAFGQFGNDALTWETSNKSDFGLDLGLFNDRLRMKFDYFVNDIDNLVFSVPVAHSLGVPNNRITKNIGKSLNKGFEMEASYDVLNKGDFSWTVGANLTLMSNKIVALPNRGADIIGGSSTDININPNIIIREGESMNSLFGYEYWGVNPANGNPVYVKGDGSLVQGNIPTGTYLGFDPNNPSELGAASSLSAATDRKILGNTLPTYFGGFTSKFGYKQFDLNFLVRFSGGNKIFNATRRDLMNLNLNNNSTEILGRWQSVENPGDGVTPRLWASSNPFVNLTAAASTRFVEDGDFVSLDNISLGYTLGSSLTKKIGVSSVRAFAQAQNVLMITKYKGLNPEMETLGVDLNGTPISRIVSFGFKCWILIIQI